jgi:hypothetical protein
MRTCNELFIYAHIITCANLSIYAHIIHICELLMNFPLCMLQTCIGHVLDCIETRARYGFMCDIDNKRMLLFPRLGAMSLDTPERVKYFGLQSLRACGICRGPRAGRSSTRSGTRHDPVHISRLYTQANAVARTLPTIRERKRRREQLQRHGLNYTKRCRLTDHAKKCLVNIKNTALHFLPD